MKISKEINLKDFEAWNGAVDTLKRLEAIDKTDIIENYIEEMQSCGQEFTETDVNDFLWFEVEFICELIGMSEDAFYEIGI